MAHRTFGRALVGIAGTLALAGIMLAAPRAAHAQSTRQVINIDITGGVVHPVMSGGSDLTNGGHIGIGISHQLWAVPLSLGVEGSFEWFSQRERVQYGLAIPGALDPGRYPPVGLALANVLLTARYPFGHRAVHPYVALAAGLTQTRLDSNVGADYPYETKGSARATIGLEAPLGRGTLGVEAGYTSIAAFEYAGRPVRYVPVMLRLSF